MITSLIRRVLDNAGYELHRQSCWPDIAKKLRHLESPVVIDVGANIGQTTKEIKKHLPRAMVFCLEPDPATFKLLQANVAGLSETQTIQLALGDVNETRLLNQNRASVTNSLLPALSTIQDGELSAKLACESQVPVQVVRLQDWCKAQSLEHVHVLKVDCQGYDLQVLRGADDLLREGRIELLCVEVSFKPLYEGQAFFDEILNFLRLRDYALYGIYDVRRDPDGGIAWADAVFMARPRIKP